MTTHTKASGTEPCDKVYCLGYQVHHEDWSPFPRVNHLRQTFLDRGYDIDVERLRYVTESYQANVGAPKKRQVSLAFEKVLDNCQIFICFCRIFKNLFHHNLCPAIWIRTASSLHRLNIRNIILLTINCCGR